MGYTTKGAGMAVVGKFFTRAGAQSYADSLTISAVSSRSSGGRRLDHVVRRGPGWLRRWQVESRGSRR